MKDIPFRAYIVQSTLANSAVTVAEVLREPELMNTKEASKYLGVSVSQVYKLAAGGRIPRTPHKKFRKTDLDAFLSGQKPLRKRKGK